MPQYFPPGHSVGIRFPAGETNLYQPGSSNWSQIGLASDESDNVTCERCLLKLLFGWSLMILWLEDKHGSNISGLLTFVMNPPVKLM